MQQVADWLEKLGMSEYAQRFVENRIDLSVLPHLTDQHLKELGVALGDRLKMLHAIGQLTDASVAAPQSTAVDKPAPQDIAERRQLAVMRYKTVEAGDCLGDTFVISPDHSP
jgi:SAM domain (Sterile alpha motif)